MLSNSKQHKKQNKIRNNQKGFILSLESTICLLILLISLNSITHASYPDLSKEMAYTQAQDIVEVCIAKKEPNPNCFKKIEKINPHISYEEKGKIEFSRKIDKEMRRITFNYTMV